jgi:hypothetical protein
VLTERGFSPGSGSHGASDEDLLSTFDVDAHRHRGAAVSDRLSDHRRQRQTGERIEYTLGYPNLEVQISASTTPC